MLPKQEQCDAQNIQREDYHHVQVEFAQLKTDLKSTRFQIRQRKNDVENKQEAVTKREQELIELLNDYNHLVCDLGVSTYYSYHMEAPFYLARRLLIGLRYISQRSFLTFKLLIYIFASWMDCFRY